MKYITRKRNILVKKHSRKKIYRKKHGSRKTFRGGDVKDDEGFIVEIDKFNTPINNSLDFENAKIFLNNFIFNDGFISKHLENDPVTLRNFLHSSNTIKLYSGDETKFDTLVENLIEKNMNLFLRLYKLIEPKSHKEFIKNLYKSETPINIESREGKLVDTMAGGVKEVQRHPPISDLRNTFLNVINYGIYAVLAVPMDTARVSVAEEETRQQGAGREKGRVRRQQEAAAREGSSRTRRASAREVAAREAVHTKIRASAREAAAREAAAREAAAREEAAREEAATREEAAAREEAAREEAAAAAAAVAAALAEEDRLLHGPLDIIIAGINIDDYRRFVVTFNQDGTLFSFISKISTDNEYIAKYLYEVNLYNQLRPLIHPPGQLENFYGWNHKKNVIIPSSGAEIRIILDFGIGSEGRYKFRKAINLRNYTTPANLLLNGFGPPKTSINWCAMHGVYTRTHSSFDLAIKQPHIDNRIITIVKGLNLIFNNLLYFYTNAGFIHCDFKLDNMLVNLTPAMDDIDGALMFDLDMSAIVPGFVAGMTRDALDLLPLSIEPLNYTDGPTFNNYLRIPYDIVPIVTAGFCHFWDIYLAAFSFRRTFGTTPADLVIFKNIFIALTLNAENFLHPNNIFAFCCKLIHFKPLNLLNGWEGVNFFNTIQHVINISRVMYDNLTAMEKIVIRWIWNQVNNCPGLEQNMTNRLIINLAW
jgi:hypothetical protein